ncbi:unnamed protein product [Rotaria sordida]|nr:unnamed protein product [Rotaria sordida]CAF1427000.1 unnamed protein product [Rotaria sordida]CAF1490704.1 unnamed protein product [Rotaria sordida]CAF1623163.1 unnamed protein product [Rotaria sordida]CAF4048865.1 unnamed protein product [Rotaria sordida]
MNELNAYAKAGQIVQEVFNSLRTVLSLNGANFEQKSIYIQSFAEGRGAAAPVFQLLDEEQELSINEREIWGKNSPEKESIDINGDIEFDNVTFAYPSREDISALHNLTLIARAGETTALVGSSGCGKSTCISLLLRYYDFSSGRIMINGRSITDYDRRQLRQNIGVVSQEPILFNMSIYENIRFGKLDASQAEIEEAAKQANAHYFIMQLPNKYETLVGERGIQLSCGEKQRVAIARALVKQPTLLLLDEATSALDNISETLVQEAVNRACKGRTTIVIAHRLTTIQNAHQIYVMDKGCVIEHGTHTTLMAQQNGKYRKMVDSQHIKEIDHGIDQVTDKEDEFDKVEREIFEQSHLSNENQLVGDDKKSLPPLSGQIIFLRLLSMNSPEWIILSIGAVACLLSGAVQPLFAVLLANIINLTVEVNQNMRTVKQLTIENEVLQKFTDLIDHSSKIHRKYSLLSAITFGINTGTHGYIFGALHWCALTLLERNEIDLKYIIM